MNLGYKPTCLKDSNPNTDRLICFNGNVIARTYQYQHGLVKGTWGWFGQWVAVNNSGRAATLADALAVVKERYGVNTSTE
jgi:hypothetical protein